MDIKQCQRNPLPLMSREIEPAPCDVRNPLEDNQGAESAEYRKPLASKEALQYSVRQLRADAGNVRKLTRDEFLIWTIHSILSEEELFARTDAAMIIELAEYLLTPCSRAFRRVGYLRGQLGIKVRHRQCRHAWRPHLELTKVAILSAAQECTQRRKCVILGSGRLLDVPLRRLSQMFQEVILVDAVHPLSAYAIAAWYRNVRLIRADVTETAEELTEVANKPDLPLPRATPTLFCDDPDIDYVASVNLLSQLAYLPGIYLENGQRSEAEVEAYSQALLLAHLDYLRRLPGIVSLITDVEKLVIDKQGRITDRIDILHGVEIPWAGEEWTWNHVPRYLLSKDQSYDRRVCAVANVKR